MERATEHSEGRSLEDPMDPTPSTPPSTNTGHTGVLLYSAMDHPAKHDPDETETDNGEGISLSHVSEDSVHQVEQKTVREMQRLDEGMCRSSLERTEGPHPKPATGKSDDPSNPTLPSTSDVPSNTTSPTTSSATTVRHMATQTTDIPGLPLSTSSNIGAFGTATMSRTRRNTWMNYETVYECRWCEMLFRDHVIYDMHMKLHPPEDSQPHPILFSCTCGFNAFSNMFMFGLHVFLGGHYLGPQYPLYTNVN